MESSINDTENITETGAKIPATPEGMAVAYISLFLMAIVSIYFGAFRSVKYHKASKESGEEVERMSHKDAAMFPLIASGTLFGLYLFFKFFSKEYVNLLLATYFFILGVFALTRIITPIVEDWFPAMFPNQDYHLILTEGKNDNKEEICNYEFTRKDIVVFAFCAAIGVWYMYTKHWLANNLFGLAFSLNGIELIHLNTVSVGCILLGGLFVYDIFWVFGTNVMVTVAKSFEAPIKLVFPQDLLEKGLLANNFAMLGLGDIVIPGIFVAILLRFDVHLNKGRKLYFYVCFVAYCLGLMTTIAVMHFFKHAQPALLYLVPFCIGCPLLVALVKGEAKEMFSYEDNPEPEEPAAKKDE